MGDSTASRRDAVIFALISLLSRLVMTQSSVFSLWFSRRCYERSRGEMITMLYEKTLKRKNIGAPNKDPVQTALTENGVNGLSEADKASFKPTTRWRRMYETFRRPLSSVRKQLGPGRAPEAPKEPATTGKILNLMR